MFCRSASALPAASLFYPLRQRLHACPCATLCFAVALGAGSRLPCADGGRVSGVPAPGTVLRYPFRPPHQSRDCPTLHLIVLACRGMTYARALCSYAVCESYVLALRVLRLLTMSVPNTPGAGAQPHARKPRTAHCRVTVAVVDRLGHRRVVHLPSLLLTVDLRRCCEGTGAAWFATVAVVGVACHMCGAR